MEAAESYEVWGETLPWTGSGPQALAQAILVVVVVLALYTEGHQHRYPAKVEGAGCHHHHRQTSVNFLSRFQALDASVPLCVCVCGIICKAETEFRGKPTSVDI